MKVTESARTWLSSSGDEKADYSSSLEEAGGEGNHMSDNIIGKESVEPLWVL